MSAFVDEKGNFINFYGTTILSSVQNKSDFIPLFTLLKNKHSDKLKLVNNLHLRIFDIFSQTLATLIGETCPLVEEWFKENGGRYYPYRMMDHSVILPTHYEAKDIIATHIPETMIVKNEKLEFLQGKLILKLKFSHYKNSIKQTVVDCNSLYKLSRKLNKTITLGYLYNSHDFEINDEISSLIPSIVNLNRPNIYHYTNIDNYKLYSDSMY